MFLEPLTRHHTFLNKWENMGCLLQFRTHKRHKRSHKKFKSIITWFLQDKTCKRRRNIKKNTCVRHRTSKQAFPRSRRWVDDEWRKRGQNLTCVETCFRSKLLPVRPRRRLSSSLLKVPNDSILGSTHSVHTMLPSSPDSLLFIVLFAKKLYKSNKI